MKKKMKKNKLQELDYFSIQEILPGIIKMYPCLQMEVPKLK
jgi:hypothetical protein